MQTIGRRTNIALGIIFRRSQPFSTSESLTLTYNEVQALDQWIASPPTHTLVDSLSLQHLSDLFITLPTRDGTKRPLVIPQVGNPLPFGHHLAFFHARRAEPDLRADGTDGDISPPVPFSRRMWAGGKIAWNNQHPLLIGSNAKAVSTVARTEKKRFEEGKPMIFVTQKIILLQGDNIPSVEEERSHVYFHVDLFSNKKKIDREVKDIPTIFDFSFNYTPTPVTLFRYSALMFNAHHIHLDKEYCQNVEGYPERLVHGPLTAQMLLEAFNFHFPEIKMREFEYRAMNPLFVNQKLTIKGTWTSPDSMRVWCCDDASKVVGMTGKIVIDK